MIEDRPIGDEVRVAARVRLHVRVIRAEKFFGFPRRTGFDRIDVFTAAVIAVFGITFGVFIGEEISHRRLYGKRTVIFACDEF